LARRFGIHYVLNMAQNRNETSFPKRHLAAEEINFLKHMTDIAPPNDESNAGLFPGINDNCYVIVWFDGANNFKDLYRKKYRDCFYRISDP
jgi:hypothetical protein